MTTFNTWGQNGVDNNRIFDNSQNTYVITHGWRNTGGYGDVPPAEWLQNAAKALRRRDPNANIIIPDWEEARSFFGLNYAKSVLAVPQVGEDIANFLIDRNVDPNKTNLIGHSLGAHASGRAGQRYRA